MTHCSVTSKNRETGGASSEPDCWRSGSNGYRVRGSVIAFRRRNSGEGVNGKVTNAILNNKTAMRLFLFLLITEEEGRDQLFLTHFLLYCLFDCLCGNCRPKRYGVRRYISLVDNALSESGAFRYTCSIHPLTRSKRAAITCQPCQPLQSGVPAFSLSLSLSLAVSLLLPFR